ncbi:hypothetical protein [Oligoflexus tunisiensis]|uniref:hypothetical protein n=1 Tax=Oligoflexus tunisiensis TaxID=708132 RepID=UPI00114CE23D|nr:hypothetical protein [Oligoflexus tunisiensis]
MPGIRTLIAFLFLFAGLESELRADAFQVKTTNYTTPSDLPSNLNRTSVFKMTEPASERILGVLFTQIIDAAPPGSTPFDLIFFTDFPSNTSRRDAWRSSGLSPPMLRDS